MQLQIPRFSTAKCQRLFKYVGTKVWNIIPQELKTRIPNLKQLMKNN